jgi:Domain of unknown function (DUF5122) beta-propeller
LIDITQTPGGRVKSSFGARALCRRIARWEHEAVLDAMQQRLDRPDSKGRILAAGGLTRSGTLRRYLSDGTVDSTFGNGGSVATPPSGQSSPVVAVSPAGHITVVNTTGNYPPGPGQFVAQYLDDGSPDTSFGNGGIAITPASSDIQPVSIQTLDDGHIVVGANLLGTVVPSCGTGSSGLVSRFNFDGSPDTTFGNGSGHVRLPPSCFVVDQMIVQMDGKPVLASGSLLTRLQGSYTWDVVEFYNSALDRYFIGSLQPDIQALDSGHFAGWVRTGHTFEAYAVATDGTNPVCRFYLPPAYGDSHFFSASPTECAQVLQKYPGFVYESPNVMYEILPNTTTGACPPGTVSAYRVWDKRPDTNHRYTTDPTVRDQMIGRTEVPASLCTETLRAAFPPDQPLELARENEAGVLERDLLERCGCPTINLGLQGRE